MPIVEMIDPVLRSTARSVWLTSATLLDRHASWLESLKSAAAGDATRFGLLAGSISQGPCFAALCEDYRGAEGDHYPTAKSLLWILINSSKYRFRVLGHRDRAAEDFAYTLRKSILDNIGWNSVFDGFPLPKEVLE